MQTLDKTGEKEVNADSRENREKGMHIDGKQDQVHIKTREDCEKEMHVDVRENSRQPGTLSSLENKDNTTMQIFLVSFPFSSCL